MVRLDNTPRPPRVDRSSFPVISGMTLLSSRSTAKIPDGTLLLALALLLSQMHVLPEPRCGEVLTTTAPTSRPLDTILKAVFLDCIMLALTMAGTTSPKKTWACLTFLLGRTRPLTFVSDSELGLKVQLPIITRAAGPGLTGLLLTTSPFGSKTRPSCPIHNRNRRPSVRLTTLNPDKTSQHPYKRIC